MRRNNSGFQAIGVSTCLRTLRKPSSRPQTATFEPAIAERDVGAHVAKGERFARVEGESDHCDERCLHWGIKSEGRQYTNPESKTRTVRIGLKGL